MLKLKEIIANGWFISQEFREELQKYDPEAFLAVNLELKQQYVIPNTPENIAALWDDVLPFTCVISHIDHEKFDGIIKLDKNIKSIRKELIGNEQTG